MTNRRGAPEKVVEFRRVRLALCFVLCALGGLLTPFPAAAAALELSELLRLEQYLSCRQGCAFGSAARFESCEAACPVEAPAWDKNLDGQLDEADHRLAFLEYWDDGAGTHVCKRAGAVLPRVECEPCESSHTAADCVDDDGDGLHLWQERALGTSDLQPVVSCNTGLDCDGFNEACRLGTASGTAGGGPSGFEGPGAAERAPVVANRVLCLPRACAATGSCTAFHLEKVAEDNEQLLVHVYFDHAPVLPTVLDLKIAYDRRQLTLADARPLAALREAGKELMTQHLGGTSPLLRLVAVGATNQRPIRPGPLAELVFLRSGASATRTQVSFATASAHRRSSMAPCLEGEDPCPALANAALESSALWGPSVAFNPPRPSGDRLLLHYAFDHPRRPLTYSAVPSAERLCALTDGAGDCEDRAKLELLQRGSARYSAAIEGVSGQAAFFDGFSDHLELPVSLELPEGGGEPSAADQSFTFSTWFYLEGDDGRGGALHEGQVLFSHNAQSSERARFGLMARPLERSTFELLWFNEALGGAALPLLEVATGLPNRTWQHLALQVDARGQRAEVFLGGAPVFEATLGGTPAIECPQFQPRLRFAEQGAQPGGRPTEALFFSSAQSGLFGIERMDAQGLDRVELIRAQDSSASDAHYSAVLDRLAFSSSETGNREIWVARGDGSLPKRVTVGFGDTARGAFARRPRWAPDGSALVFESNIATADAGDNISGGYQLYYVPFDPQAGQVAVAPAAAAGAAATQLDYRSLLATQRIGEFRLTEGAAHHQNARWLRGASSSGGAPSLGELVLTGASLDFDQRWPERLPLREPLRAQTAPEPFDPFLGGSAQGGFSSARVSVLAARANLETAEAEVLLKQESVHFAAASQYSLTQTTEGFTTNATVAFAPTADCWDQNGNGACDLRTEDRTGDEACDPSDCLPSEVRELYIEYPTGLSPVRDPSGGLEVLAGPLLAESGKELKAEVLFASDGNRIKLEVLSPTSGAAIPAGARLATLRFDGSSATASRPLHLQRREAAREYYLQTGDALPQRLVFDGSISDILEADFSPSGEEVALSVLSHARPLLAVQKLVVEGERQAPHLRVLSERPTRVEGLQWVPIDKFFPCNWVGGFRNPATGSMLSGFRGGLDELKLHSYLLAPATIASEAARGAERLGQAGRAGALPTQSPVCSSDLDCPSYELCNASTRQCESVPCGPAAASAAEYNCERGSCSLMPLSVGGGPAPLGWVCSVECATEAQCFQQQCGNGPCRFCGEATGSCEECRFETDAVLGFEYVAGCPDRNSFACEYGHCLTECYSVQDGQSTYLCDPLTEFCKQGQCVLQDWSWADLAPATLSGLGETIFANEALPETTAISQLHPVRLTAFGVEDYQHPPELLVEGRAASSVGGAYGGDWFDLGRIVVHNTTQRQATQERNKYTVYAPVPITELRLRLLAPPYTNLSGGGTGLLGRVGEFCAGADAAECERRASGSRANLGYRASIPEHEALRACAERNALRGVASDCGYDAHPLLAYAYGGQPAVVLSDIEVAGTSVFNGITENWICPYRDEQGNPTASPGPRGARRVVYGDAQQEASAQRVAHYPSGPSTQLLAFDTAESGFALLNCNYGRARGAERELAQVRVRVGVDLTPPATAGRVTETASSCTVEVDPQTGAFEPCYEWMGGPTLDAFSAETQLYRTLEWESFTSFGYCNPLPPGSPEAYDCAPL